MSAADRAARCRNALAPNGWDALLLTSPAARLYVTGFASSAGVVLITQQNACFFTDFRYEEAARETVAHMDVTRATQETPYTALVGAMAEAQQLKTIAFESHTMTVESFAAWQKALPGLVWQDAQAVLATLRAAKDADELAAMERAQAITETALWETLPLIREGITEQALCAELIYRLYKHGAQRPSFDPIVLSGPRASLPHGVPSDRAVAAGDFVLIDFGCVCGGYCSDMTRTFAVGEATDEMRHVYHTVLAAQEAGIGAARPGVPGCDIDGAARAVIEEAGFGAYFGHGFGHGIGIEVHEGYNANPSEKRPLPENCVISAEPGIYLPGRLGVRIEDMLHLCGSGARNLTRFPKEMMMLPS